MALQLQAKEGAASETRLPGRPKGVQGSATRYGRLLWPSRVPQRAQQHVDHAVGPPARSASARAAQKGAHHTLWVVSQHFGSCAWQWS
jgi:hypothetical protein